MKTQSQTKKSQGASKGRTNPTKSTGTAGKGKPSGNKPAGTTGKGKTKTTPAKKPTGGKSTTPTTKKPATKRKTAIDPLMAFQAIQPAAQVVLMPRWFGCNIVFSGTPPADLLQTLEREAMAKGFTTKMGVNSLDITMTPIWEKKEIQEIANTLARIISSTPGKLKTKVRMEGLSQPMPTSPVLMGTASLSLIEPG